MSVEEGMLNLSREHLGYSNEEMRMDGDVVKGHEMVAPHMALETLKEWAKRLFSKKRLAEVAATVAVLGYIGAVLYQIFQTY